MMSFGTPVLSNIASPMKYKQQYMRQQAELSRHKQHLHWQQQIRYSLDLLNIALNSLQHNRSLGSVQVTNLVVCFFKELF